MPNLDVEMHGRLASEVRAVIEPAPLPGLNAEPKCPDTAQAIQELSNSPGVDNQLLQALWLLAGDLERSHHLSQSDSTPEGSFWHGIMHRREGDYGNAKYWFHRVGPHPVVEQLAEMIEERRSGFEARDLPLDGLLDLRRQNDVLVDLSRSALSDHPQWQTDAQRICWWQWQLLLRHGLR